MLINKEITYTPEIITVIKGNPIKAIVEAVGIDGTLAIRFADGSIERVPSNLCSPN